MPLESRLVCYARSQVLTLKSGVPKYLPDLVTLKLVKYGLVHTRGNKAGIRVRKREKLNCALLINIRIFKLLRVVDFGQR